VQAERLAQRPKLREMLPLLAFTGLYVFVYAGEPIKYGYLPIYMRDDLHLLTAVSGAVIGSQPLIELILMPVAVVVARRIGMMRLMILGAAFGVGANLCFALTGDVAGMFAGQILMGGVWGVFAALGIIVAQRLLPRRRDRLSRLHQFRGDRQRPRRADRQPRRQPSRPAACVLRPGSRRTHRHRRDRRHEPLPVRRALARTSRHPSAPGRYRNRPARPGHSIVSVWTVAPVSSLYLAWIRPPSRSNTANPNSAQSWPPLLRKPLGCHVPGGGIGPPAL